MDVEDVEECVVWVKPKAYDAQSMILLLYGKRPRTPLRESVKCAPELGLHLSGSFLLIYRPLDDRESLRSSSMHTIVLVRIGSKIVIIAFWKADGAFFKPNGITFHANGIDPDKIPYHVMWNISIWSKEHPEAYKRIEANGQWLYDNFDHYEVETSDDEDDARSLWSSDDDEHFDSFEDDPTHPDACWSP
nr:hypothetical protein [Tanacetum cinerariifolium]